MNEQESAELTKRIWDKYARFSNVELDELLTCVGVDIIGLTRGELIAICIVKWFGGNPPNFKKLDEMRLNKEYW